MNNKEVHRYVMKRFDTFFRERGFARQGSGRWVSSAEEIIREVILHFSYGQECFDLDIVVQPWCVPEDDVYLTVSVRLSRLAGERVWGSYEENKLEEDIKDALLVMERDGLGLLQRVSDCLSLARVIDRTGISIFTVSPVEKARLFAYIYFYKHRFLRAWKWYRKYIGSGFGAVSDTDNFARLEKYAEEGEYEKVDGFFRETFRKNAEKFGLNCKIPWDSEGSGSGEV